MAEDASPTQVPARKASAHPANLDGHQFEAVVIGAGMAGMAAALRLAMFDRKVLLLERHYVPGGLNSFYARGGRKFDVGLHAVTNYVPPGTKGTPLAKLCRQLRIPHEEFGLSEQSFSRVAFPEADLRFSNDFDLFFSEVESLFPDEKDRFVSLLREMDGFDAYSLQPPEASARAILSERLNDPLLVEMLLCPTCYYGSAHEDDVDFATFVILFDAIFRQGFARPFEGVRRMINPLVDRYRKLGGLRRMNLGVRRLVVADGTVERIELENGETIRADHIISTCGAVETERLLSDSPPEACADRIGRLTFVECITVFEGQPSDLGWEETIVFFNDSETLAYSRPEDFVDSRSGVICLPNNYRYPDGKHLPEGFFRVTCPANPHLWNNLEEETYRAEKERARLRMTASALRFLPNGHGRKHELEERTLFVDSFSPRTITNFTSHLEGALYGSPEKRRDGSTRLSNLYLAGTDQGFVGIVGAMLGGIMVANDRILALR